MDAYSNAWTRTDGGSNADDGVLDGGVPAGGELRQAVSTAAAEMDGDARKQREIMQQLEGMAAQADQRAQQYQAQIEGVRQEAQAVQASTQQLQSQLRACEESAQSAAQRVQGVEQNVQSVEQVLADLGEQFTLLKRTSDETTGTVSNVAVSIGELSQDVNQLKELRQAIAEAKEEIDALKQMKRAHPVRAAVVTAVTMILVISGYVMLGMPGWQAVAGYVPWLRG